MKRCSSTPASPTAATAPSPTRAPPSTSSARAARALLVKTDGLAAGKGVMVTGRSFDEAWLVIYLSGAASAGAADGSSSSGFLDEFWLSIRRCATAQRSRGLRRRTSSAWATATPGQHRRMGTYSPSIAGPDLVDG